jgi:uncharacterized membrane protein
MKRLRIDRPLYFKGKFIAPPIISIIVVVVVVVVVIVAVTVIMRCDLADNASSKFREPLEVMDQRQQMPASEAAVSAIGEFIT